MINRVFIGEQCIGCTIIFALLPIKEVRREASCALSYISTCTRGTLNKTIHANIRSIRWINISCIWAFSDACVIFLKKSRICWTFINYTSLQRFDFKYNFARVCWTNSVTCLCYVIHIKGFIIAIIGTFLVIF